MKYCLLLFLMLSTNAMAQSDYLLQYEWKNRIILLFADKVDEQLKAQLHELEKDWEGVEERDLKIFVIFPDSMYEMRGDDMDASVARSLREKYHSNDTSFQYILIGKDGTIKMQEKILVKNEKLFASIDAMPMRQREMREKKE